MPTDSGGDYIASGASSLSERLPALKMQFPCAAQTGVHHVPQPLPITAVNHVGRKTKRLEESRKFYKEVLGFREVSRPNFDFPGAWLYNYGIMIHLIHSPSATDPDGEIDTRGDHLALNTNDFEGAEELLKQFGIPYRKNVVVDRNIKQIFFRDPDGHHIEIATYPPTPAFV